MENERIGLVRSINKGEHSDSYFGVGAGWIFMIVICICAILALGIASYNYYK